MLKKSKMSLLVKAASVTAFTTGLIACGADNPTLDPSKATVEYSELRILNALPGAPTLSISIGAADAEAESFRDIAYGDAKPFFAVEAGATLNVIVTASVPGVYALDPADGTVGLFDADGDIAVGGDTMIASATAVLYKGTMTFTADAKQDLVLSGALTVGNVLDTAIATGDTTFSYDLTTNAIATPTVAASDATGGITLGNFSSAAVDVYATATCATLVAGDKIADLAVGASVVVDPTTLAGTAAEVCIAADGGGVATFDSGSLTLAADDWVNVLDNTNGITGASAQSLSVQSGANYSLITDETDEAELRIVHAVESNNAGTLDVTYGPVSANNVAFEGVVAYQAIASNNASGDVAYTSTVTVTGAGTAEETLTGLTVVDGESRTVVAYDTADGIVTATLSDDRRSIDTEARVRFVQGSLAEAEVNIYVVLTADVADITEVDTDGEFVLGATLTMATAADNELSLAAGAYTYVITTPAVDEVTDVTTGAVTTAAVAEDRATPLHTGIFTVVLGDIVEHVITDTAGTTLNVVTL